MERRLRFLRVRAGWYADMCKGRMPQRIRVVDNHLPADCRVLDHKITEQGAIVLLLASDSFSELKEAEDIPEQPSPVFAVIHDDMVDKIIDDMIIFADNLQKLGTTAELPKEDLRDWIHKLSISTGRRQPSSTTDIH